MDVRLENGEKFLISFPVFVPMRHGGGNLYAPEPICFANATRHMLVYTDEDLARVGIESQSLENLVPLVIRDALELRRVILHYKQSGATYLAIDICTVSGRASGHVVPIDNAIESCQ